MVDIQAVWVWLGQEAKSVEASGVGMSLRLGPADRTPRSVAASFESTLGVGQLTIWESGAAEVIMGLLDGSEVQVMDISINERAALAAAVANIVEALR